MSASDLCLHGLLGARISCLSRLFVRLKLLLVLESRNHRVLLVIILFPSLKFVLVDSLLVLGHISIHLKSIVLSLLIIKLVLVILNLLLLVGKDTLVDDRILVNMLLNLLLLVVLNCRLIALFSKLVILHLFDELVLVVHALTELLFLHKASRSIHTEHSFLLTFALVLGFADLALAFRTTYSSEVVMVHALLELISLLHSVSLCRVTVSKLLNGRTNFHSSFSFGKLICEFLLLKSFPVALLEDVLGLHLLSDEIFVVSVSSDSIALYHVCVKLFFVHALLVS